MIKMGDICSLLAYISLNCEVRNFPRVSIFLQQENLAALASAGRTYGHPTWYVSALKVLDYTNQIVSERFSICKLRSLWWVVMTNVG